MNYNDYKRLIQSCGQQFYIDNYRLIREWSSSKKDLIDYIFNTKKYGSNRSGIVTRVNAAQRIIDSQFIDFPFSSPIAFNVFYDSHVFQGERDINLIHLVEDKLDKLDIFRCDVPIGYGLPCWFPDSSMNHIPNVCLNKEILQYTISYTQRDLSDTDEEIMKSCDCPRDRQVNQLKIVLSEFLEEFNTIILYYNAIEEYAQNNKLDFEEVLFGVLAAEFFKACYYRDVEEFENEDIWIYYRHDTNIGRMCTDVIEGMSQFYSYVMLDSYYGTSNYASLMRNSWRNNFSLNDPYAQALYFLYNGSKPFIDLASCIEKFNAVYPAESIFKAFNSMRYAFDKTKLCGIASI